MTCFTRTRALIGIGFVGALAATTMAAPTHAATRIHNKAKDSVVSWGRKTVVIDNIGSGKSDAALSVSTHWECHTALDNPNDPFTCTRVQGANADLSASSSATNGALLGLHAGYAPLTVGKAGRSSSRSAGISGPNSCANTGGIKIFQNAYLGGDCAQFTGMGQLYLQNLNFPATADNVGGQASSLSTIGSNGHGSLLCAGGTPPGSAQLNFTNNSAYNYIGDGCNDKVNGLVSN